MKLSDDFHATRRREALRRYQEWLSAEEYRREKAADRGGMFPAVCWLVAVVIVAAVIGAVLRQVS